MEKRYKICLTFQTNTMLIRYFIYGLLGWNLEILWTGLGSLLHGSPNMMGHTSLWMFFIYGLAAFILEPIHNKIAGWRWIWRGLIWVAVIFAIEFLAGMLLRFMGIQAWFYEGPAAVMGVIRLDYAPAWFAAGLLFERVHLLLLKHEFGVKRGG